MRLVTYSHGSTARLGAVNGRLLIDVAHVCERAGANPPSNALAAAVDSDCTAAVHEALAGERSGSIVQDIGAFRLGVPIPRPGKIFALAANYPAHAEEVGEEVRDKASSIPHVFPKLPSSLVAHDAPIVIPPISDMVDYEVELAVVIGRQARGIPCGSALDYIAGYAVFNDVSARRLQFKHRPSPPDEDSFWDFLYGKWCDGFAIVGPYLVTPDEIPDPHQLRMELRVNGAVRQSALTGEMIFDVADAISFLSSVCTLEPGDVIAMGTPAGIGEMGEGCLKPGDLVEATIEGLGSLANRVVAGGDTRSAGP